MKKSLVYNSPAPAIIKVVDTRELRRARLFSSNKGSPRLFMCGIPGVDRHARFRKSFICRLTEDQCPSPAKHRTGGVQSRPAATSSRKWSTCHADVTSCVFSISRRQ
jgi:hypothetical protein